MDLANPVPETTRRKSGRNVLNAGSPRLRASSSTVPDSPVGPGGCALHLAALASDESPIDWKPAVCSQLPIHVEWDPMPDGRESATVRRWSRADWGLEGETMAWCCTEEVETYVGDRPVIESLADELAAIAGVEVWSNCDVASAALKGCQAPSARETSLAGVRRRARYTPAARWRPAAVARAWARTAISASRGDASGSSRHARGRC
jgi:hypothetical protein